MQMGQLLPPRPPVPLLSPGPLVAPPGPGPVAHQPVAPAAPEGTSVHSWYNVTVLVKMDFGELQQVDARLLDHMRLLHSMVGEGRASLQAALLAPAQTRVWGGVPRVNLECPALKQMSIPNLKTKLQRGVIYVQQRAHTNVCSLKFDTHGVEAVHHHGVEHGTPIF